MTKAQTPPGITIEILRFYTKEQSCKVPYGYQAFPTEKDTIPGTGLENQTEMSINHQPIAQDTFEITLNVTVTGKIEQKTAYTANVQQSCALKIGTKDEQALTQIMSVHIPNMLHPYVRKNIADLIGNSGFMPVFLPIVDFASMHQQQLAQAEKINQSIKTGPQIVDAEIIN